MGCILSLIFTANENIINKDFESCGHYYVGRRCYLFERYKFEFKITLTKYRNGPENVIPDGQEV